MKKILFLFLAIIFLQACKSPTTFEMPIPTDGNTVVKADMENPEKSNAKKEWLKKIFRTPDGITAEEIETQNSYRRFLQRNTAISTRTPVETIADGKITGEWKERGSSNQSGSVFKTAYDHTTDELFLISAGAHIWKGTLDGFNWEVVNDKGRFSNRFIDVVYTEDGTQRLLSALSNKPHYSDDGGQTWTVAENFTNQSFNNFKDVYTNEDSLSYTYLLGRLNNNDNMHLYMSTDRGVNYDKKFTFTTKNPDKISLSISKSTNEVFVVEEISNNNSRVFKMDVSQENLELITSFSPFSYGSKRAKLVASSKDGVSYLYGLSSIDGISTYLTNDMGVTWTKQGNLPTDPWGVGIFVSSENPDYLMYGDIECYRSFDGGVNWEMINGWAEYYGDITNKLHADMMWFSDYKDKDTDEYFMLISNHGGISIMNDYDQEPKNISLLGLNVSQYYSVRTDPVDEEWIYAGAQDQGFQRGKIKDGIMDLGQAISGDYGHIVFTREEHLWTVYPGGWVSYWPFPKNNGIAMSYTVESSDESVWIPPLTTVPDGFVDQIYMAGGNINGGSGSYIIKLTATDDIFADQIDFDFKAASGGAVSAITVADQYEERIFVATENGKFFYSVDYGENFVQSANVNGGHYLYGQVIIPSENNHDVIYTGGTGYNGVPVMRSVDGGETFSPFGDGLPNTTVLGMVMNDDETLMFAATTSGPYVCILSEEKWYDMSGMYAPDVTYWSVELVNNNNTVRFGTYGRGIFDFDITNFVGNKETELSDNQRVAKVYPNPVTDFVTIEWPEDKIENVEIYSINGQKVRTIDIDGSTTVVSLVDLQAGQYVLRYTVNNEIQSQNIIKI